METAPASEGAVGGYWGLFDADRQEKGILAGRIDLTCRTGRCGWGWVVSSLLGTLVLGGRVRSTRAAMALPLLGAVAACSIGTWAELTRVTARFNDEWGVGGVVDDAQLAGIGSMQHWH